MTSGRTQAWSGISICARQASDPKVLLCLIVNGKTLAKKEALVRTIREQVPEVSGIVINYNTKRATSFSETALKHLLETVRWKIRYWG